MATRTFGIQNGTGFTFSQEFRPKLEGDNRFPKVHLFGDIHVKPASAPVDYNIRVDVVAHTSHPEHIQIECIEEPDAFIGMTLLSRLPANLVENGAREPFVRAEVTIWVMPGVIIPKFQISTQSLAVTFHAGLRFGLEGPLELSANDNPIYLSSDPSTMIYSRDIIIHTTSGSVRGTYPLYDLLSIDTESGSIDVHLDVQDVSPALPKPAKLDLKSLSGSIRVLTDFIASQDIVLPPRDYQSDISARSGSVDVNIPHGSMTSLDTQSGSLSATLYPCGDPSIRSDLISTGRSGSTRITIHGSRTHPNFPLRKLYADHHQESGSLKLHYPSTWEGHIWGKAGSGAIRIDWPGVRIISDHRDDPVRRSIEAMRGFGEGVLQFSSLSGSVDLTGDT